MRNAGQMIIGFAICKIRSSIEWCSGSKILFSKSIMLNDKDWSVSSIHEIIEDILETKKATLGSKGFYSHVSGEIF